MGKVHRKLAQTIKHSAEHSAMRHRATHIATVIDLAPFRVELHDRADVLTEGVDLWITQWVFFYHAAWGVEIDDNAVVLQLQGAHWWVDVASSVDCSPATATVAWGV